jgi:hypothetical protein
LRFADAQADCEQFNAAMRGKGLKPVTVEELAAIDKARIAGLRVGVGARSAPTQSRVGRLLIARRRYVDDHRHPRTTTRPAVLVTPRPRGAGRPKPTPTRGPRATRAGPSDESEPGEPEPPARRLVCAKQLALELGVGVGFVYDHADLLGAIRLGAGPKARLRFDLEDAIARLRREAPAESHTPRPSCRTAAPSRAGTVLRSRPKGGVR